MPYQGFRVELERDGWYVKSQRISVEAQMTLFRTRRAAIDATREVGIDAWLYRMFVPRALW